MQKGSSLRPVDGPDELRRHFQPYSLWLRITTLTIFISFRPEEIIPSHLKGFFFFLTEKPQITSLLKKKTTTNSVLARATYTNFLYSDFLSPSQGSLTDL